MFEKLRAGLGGILSKVTTKDLSEKDLDELSWELQLVLVQNDVALPIAEEILADLKKSLTGEKVQRGHEEEYIRAKLRDAIQRILLAPGSIDLIKLAEEKRAKHEPLKLVFVGVNGTGKTTSIAKVANLLKNRGFSVLLVAGDTFRAGSEEQLQQHADRIGVKMMKHHYGADPAAVAYDAIAHARAQGVNVVLIDTAGRMQTDKSLMEELKKVVRISEPDLVIFVGDSLAGNDALNQATEYEKAVSISAVILTKTDADSKGGAILSVAEAVKKPILYVGTGQSYEDLQPFNPDWFLSKVFP